jgi:ubiquinone/menaquinone biosynthesis C-methylase UbiE
MTSPASDLQKEYAIRFSQIAEYRNSVWKVIIGQFLQKQIGKNKRILDLGSGWGEFINNVQASKKYAMDLNPESKSKISPDVTFLEQDCSKTWNLPDNSLDVVFTSNFFEHLPTKICLLDTLRQASRCLRPSGTIICLGPNIKYTGDDYWDFFDHYLQLSHLSLAEGLRMADFQVSEVIPKFLPYTMAGGRKWPLIFLSLYLKSPLAWKIFGKQFLITATKP